MQLYIHSILEYYNTYYSRGNKFLDALKFATTQTLKQRAWNYFVIYCLYKLKKKKKKYIIAVPLVH